MTLRRTVITIVVLGTALYAIVAYTAFRPSPLAAEEQSLVGDWAIGGTDDVFHFRPDRSFSLGDTDLGRWTLKKGTLNLHYRGTSTHSWLPSWMRGFVCEVAIEFDDLKGTATISDPTAVLPHPVWERQRKE